jgi:GDP-L-fucose synthase
MPAHNARQVPKAANNGTPSFLSDKSAKVFLAGHKGMLGTAIHRRLAALGFTNIVGRTRAELDLTCEPAVHKFFDAEQPRYVILAAGKVGGLHASSAAPADFMTENLRITVNVLTAARRCGTVRKLLFLATSAVYPVDAPQPIPESALLTGPPAPGNEWFVVLRSSSMAAKILQERACIYTYGRATCNSI